MQKRKQEWTCLEIIFEFWLFHDRTIILVPLLNILSRIFLRRHFVNSSECAGVYWWKGRMPEHWAVAHWPAFCQIKFHISDAPTQRTNSSHAFNAATTKLLYTRTCRWKPGYATTFKNFIEFVSLMLQPSVTLFPPVVVLPLNAAFMLLTMACWQGPKYPLGTLFKQ